MKALSRYTPGAGIAACLLAVACNAVLGIEEPQPWPSNNNTGGGAGTTTTTTGGTTTGGTTTGTGSSGNTNRDGGSGGTKATFEWAQWPMPNPATAGLPNAQSYDRDSVGGVVRDLVTGLQWQQAVDEASYTWSDAAIYCGELTAASGGWRLPSRIELISLIDYTQANPVIDSDAFPQTPTDYFWTASSFAGEPESAWTVNFKFSSGFTEKSEKAKPHRVRCVR